MYQLRVCLAQVSLGEVDLRRRAEAEKGGMKIGDGGIG
jgi:hypothetical protein